MKDYLTIKDSATVKMYAIMLEEKDKQIIRLKEETKQARLAPAKGTSINADKVGGFVKELLTQR